MRRKPIHTSIALLCIIAIEPIFASPDLLLKSFDDPGEEAVVFAPGLVSEKGRLEQNITFSPNGDEIYYTITNEDWSKCSISGIRYDEEEGAWREIDTSQVFIEDCYETEPRFSIDGQSLYFVSSRPRPKLGEDFTGSALWVSRRSETGWAPPTKVKGVEDAWHPHIDKQSRLHFLSYKLGGFGGGDIFRTDLSAPNTKEAMNLGEKINSAGDDADPFISRDGSTLLFDSNREGGSGHFDMYMSRKDQDDQWTDAVNLGSSINTKYAEYSGAISPDGRFLFFSRRYLNKEGKPENDIFWVRASILNAFETKSEQGGTDS